MRQKNKLYEPDESIELKKRKFETFDPDYSEKGKEIRDKMIRMYETIERRKNKKISTSYQVDDAIKKIMNSESTVLRAIEKNVLEVLDNERSGLPNFGTGKTFIYDTEVLTDPQLLGELDTISKGLADRLVNGTFQMTKTEVNLIKTNLKFGLGRQTKATVDSYNAWKSLVAVLLKNVKIVRVNQTQDAMNILKFNMNFLPEEEDFDIPFPEPTNIPPSIDF